MKTMLNQTDDTSLIDEKIKTRRLNVEVDTDLYKAMKYYSISNDKSISSITRKLWYELLKKI